MIINTFKNKTDFLMLFSIYLLANILYLINTQFIYWDDYSVYKHSVEEVMEQFGNTKVYTNGYILAYFANVVGVFWIRVISVSLFFLSGLLIKSMISSLNLMDRNSLFWIVLFYLIAPFNLAKIAVVNFPWMVLYASFVFAAYLQVVNLKKFGGCSFVIRGFSLLLFFTSFFCQSLIMFYIIPVTFFYFFQFKNFSISDLKIFIRKNFDFILLPFVFFLFKLFLLQPTGSYDGYNQITIHKLLIAIFSNFKYIGKDLLGILNLNIYFSISIFFTLFLLYLIKARIVIFGYIKKDLFFILLGIFFLYLASYPYVVVGKPPIQNDWSSRYELLFPLGAAFIFYYTCSIFAKFFFSKTLKIVLLVFLSSYFVFTNNYGNYKYLIDGIYQASLELNLKENVHVKNNTYFIVKNEITGFLAQQRKMRFYEYNGMARFVFGDSKRLFINDGEVLSDVVPLKNYRFYNFADWSEESPVRLKIMINKKPMEFKEVFWCIYYLNTNKEKYEKNIRPFVSLKFA